MIKIATALVASLVTTTAIASTKIDAGTYTIDSTHSFVTFSVAHLMGEADGRFTKFDGELTLAEKFTTSTVKTNIDPASINTDNQKRDDHLRNPDFFDVTKYPTMTFVSKKVTGTPTNMTVVGDLTMRGVTKEVTLKGKMSGIGKGMMGETRAAFVASTMVKRKDFGLTWNKVVEGTSAVGEEVKITLRIQAIKNDSTKKQASN
jgi:polyisoprenoid-binding protein YceI